MGDGEVTPTAHLYLLYHLDGEDVGNALKDIVWAVLEGLQGQNVAIPVHQHVGGVGKLH